MCVLHSSHGSVLGDGGRGLSRHSSPPIGSISAVWCAWFQGSLDAVLQRHQRALSWRLDRGSGYREVEFAQTNRTWSAVVYWSAASMVTISVFFCKERQGKGSKTLRDNP